MKPIHKQGSTTFYELTQKDLQELGAARAGANTGLPTQAFTIASDAKIIGVTNTRNGVESKPYLAIQATLSDGKEQPVSIGAIGRSNFVTEPEAVDATQGVERRYTVDICNDSFNVFRAGTLGVGEAVKGKTITPTGKETLFVAIWKDNKVESFKEQEVQLYTCK